MDRFISSLMRPFVSWLQASVGILSGLGNVSGPARSQQQPRDSNSTLLLKIAVPVVAFHSSQHSFSFWNCPMFDHRKTRKPIPPRTQQLTIQSVVLGIGVLLFLQTILLVVLIFQQQGKSVEANTIPPDCIQQFGFNPKIPQSDGIDCPAAPISIAQKV